ncbi:hypothetical protein EMPG_11202 [Blastomyces silverae]|uniref:Uncharacterized protein n=1 Tax=Blastomyces silverae TaxID=2060906 RepID=A0A0H1B1W2_9EURO|nr:hypothetical protein EMPG_11202 [Blastomyces silverae]
MPNGSSCASTKNTLKRKPNPRKAVARPPLKQQKLQLRPPQRSWKTPPANPTSSPASATRPH